MFSIDPLINEQYKREKKEWELKQSKEKILESYNMIVEKLCLKEWELKQSKEKILESYNMIVEKLCLKEWEGLKKIVDWAFEKERKVKEEKLTITSEDLVNLIDYEKLDFRM